MKSNDFKHRLYVIFEDITSLTIWILLINKLFFHSKAIYGLVDKIFSSSYYLEIRQYRLLLIVLLAILFLILAKRGAFKYIGFYIVHLVFFPIIVIFQSTMVLSQILLRYGKNKRKYFRVLIVVSTILPIVALVSVFFGTSKLFKSTYKGILAVCKVIKIIYVNLVKTATKLYIQLFCIFLALISFYTIAVSSNIIVIWYCIYALLIVVLLHLLYLLIWTINPLMIINNFYSIAEKIWMHLKKEMLKEDGMSEKNDNKDLTKEKESLAEAIKDVAVWCNWFKGKIAAMTQKKLLWKWFMAHFFGAFVFIIVVFSFEYYGLTKIDSNNFLILKGKQYFDHLYYSVSVLTALNSDGIIPLTKIAKLFVILEVLAGISLLTILVTSFSLITFEAASEDKKQLLEKIDSELIWLDSVARTKLDTNLENLLRQDDKFNEQ